MQLFKVLLVVFFVVVGCSSSTPGAPSGKSSHINSQLASNNYTDQTTSTIATQDAHPGPLVCRSCRKNIIPDSEPNDTSKHSEVNSYSTATALNARDAHPKELVCRSCRAIAPSSSNPTVNNGTSTHLDTRDTCDFDSESHVVGPVAHVPTFVARQVVDTDLPVTSGSASESGSGSGELGPNISIGLVFGILIAVGLILIAAIVASI